MRGMGRTGRENILLKPEDLIPLPEGGCLIQGEASHAAVQAVLTWMRETGAPAYDETTGRGLVRHIMTRSTTAGGLMVVPVVTDARIPQPELLVRLPVSYTHLTLPTICSV